MDKKINRRGFVKRVVGAGAASLIGSQAFAQAAQSSRHEPAERSTVPAGKLPARGEFIVRNGYVLTMDEMLGDLPDGDVHVKNGAIIAVGKNLKAPGVAVLDARRIIVMPGFIDTHWHMWTTYLRCMAGDKMEDGYFPMTTRYGRLMQPEDMYSSTRLAAAEAIYSGAVQAICGAIDEMRRQIDTNPATVRCYLAGGAAREIGLRLNPPVEVVDNLVLEGVLALAGEMGSS